MEGAGRVVVEGIGGGGRTQVLGRGDDLLASPQGTAQRRLGRRDVRAGVDGLVVVQEIAGQVGQDAVQPPAQQASLGVGLAVAVAGMIPGGPLPADTEMVVGGREVRHLQRGVVEPWPLLQGEQGLVG